MLTYKFIYEKHIEGISDLGIHMVALTDIKKTISERNAVNWGATIITNKGFLELQQSVLLKNKKKQQKEL
jgi:hypothetical protein